MNKKWIWAIAIVFLALPFGTVARGAVVEAEQDLQHIMGDLYTLSTAMLLYHDDTKNAQCPSIEELERYFKKPLPDSWPGEYRTAVIEGGWWVGRQVPEFSNARKFLRRNAPALGLYDKESMSAWLGQSFVWIEALSFRKETTLRVVQGEEKERLFFNSPGTDYYWWSNLLFTSRAYNAALVKCGAIAKALAIPPAPTKERETFTASPVSPPLDFRVGGEQDEGGPQPVEMADVIFNPIPRPRD
ncbi:MAG: hypothetical protein LBJ36_12425 [Synergistaceae bacterium]|nr:hypothetical protein [Synergistaceae bacterium]